MNGINLLPWREVLRIQDRKNCWMGFFFSISGALLIITLLFLYFNTQLAKQIIKSKKLQSEITGLHQEITQVKNLKESKKDVIENIRNIKRLQTYSLVTFIILAEIGKIIPKSMYFKQIKRYKNTLTLIGYTESNADISFFLHNLEQNSKFKDPKLLEIKKDALLKSKNEFSIQCFIDEKD
jgi:type IV pilus assembly protein PilN